MSNLKTLILSKNKLSESAITSIFHFQTNLENAGGCGDAVASVNVVEIADGLEVATAQAALGGNCRVSLVGVGLSISPMPSTAATARR